MSFLNPPRQTITRFRRPVAVSLVTLLSLLSLPITAQDKDEEDKQITKKITALARTVLVPVEAKIRILDDTPVRTTLDQQHVQLARNKQSIRIVAAVLDQKRLMIPDNGMTIKRVESWTATLPDGRKIPLVFDSHLIDSPAITLTPKDDSHQWTPPTVTDDVPNHDEGLVSIAVRVINDQILLQPLILRPVISYSEEISHPTWVHSRSSNSAVRLIFTTKGNLVGACCADELHETVKAPLWRYQDLKTAAHYDESDWKNRSQKAIDGLRAHSYPVRVVYRRPKNRSQPYDDSEQVGWAFSTRRMLVPYGLNRARARYVSQVSVTIDGEDQPCTFVGHFKDLDAFVVELADADAALPEHDELKVIAEFKPYQPHISIRMHQKYGAPDLEPLLVRPTGTRIAYLNQTQPKLVPAVSPGSLILDIDGHPIAWYTRRRRPLEELDVYVALTRGPISRTTSQSQILQSALNVTPELFMLSEWKDRFTSPDEYFDPMIEPKAEEKENERLWLGFEFSPMNRQLAESLECRKITKDGSVGLMISQIYPGSPAARAELRPGDIVLRLRLSERDGAVELSQPARFPGSGGRPTGPWKSRGNYLTNLLGTIGTETQLNLEYWRDGEVATIAHQLEDAPIDQDSAPEFKDERLGFTVKPVTYEVRSALNMKDDEPGLVVTKVESGSSAGLARLRAGEIIKSVDGKPITSIDQIEEILTQARTDSKEQVRVVIVARGQPRFADLKIQSEQ